MYVILKMYMYIPTHVGCATCASSTCVCQLLVTVDWTRQRRRIVAVTLHLKHYLYILVGAYLLNALQQPGVMQAGRLQQLLHGDNAVELSAGKRTARMAVKCTKRTIVSFQMAQSERVKTQFENWELPSFIKQARDNHGTCSSRILERFSDGLVFQQQRKR